MEERPSARILVAEDDDEFRILLASALRSGGHDVVSCRTGDDLLLHLRMYLLQLGDEEHDLIISDIRMPGASGLDVLESLKGCQSRPPMILITAFGDDATHAQARELGAASVLDKPFRIDVLLSEVRRVLDLQFGERSPPESRPKDHGVEDGGAATNKPTGSEGRDD
jgi:DNA-binding response OmpR family regulator